MSSPTLKNFLDQHCIRVLDTNKRAHRYTHYNYDYFKHGKDYNIIEESVRYDTEPLWTVEVAESELEKMADFESQVFANMRIKGHYNMFEHLMEQKEKEKFLKENYPAVKKAYEHYSLMLKLAESGEL